MARTIRIRGEKIKGTLKHNGEVVGTQKKLTKKQWARYVGKPKQYTVTFKED